MSSRAMKKPTDMLAKAKIFALVESSPDPTGGLAEDPLGDCGHRASPPEERSSTAAVTDRPGRSLPSVDAPSSNRMRTGTRCTILVKLPVAFSGGSTLNCAPVAGARLATCPRNIWPGSTSASMEAGNPGRICASWLSLKLASTHRPCAGTSEMSCAPTMA